MIMIELNDQIKYHYESMINPTITMIMIIAVIYEIKYYSTRTKTETKLRSSVT